MEEMTISEAVLRAGKKAKEASRRMAAASPEAKNRALLRLAGMLEEREAELLEANGRDLEAARLAGLDGPRMDRLRLTPAVLADMAGMLPICPIPWVPWILSGSVPTGFWSDACVCLSAWLPWCTRRAPT